MSSDLPSQLLSVFATDSEGTPETTLRSGDSIDSNGTAIPFDFERDAVSDDYLTQYHCGVAYLDAASWRHYLPMLGEFALRHLDSNSLVVGALIASLRPPDRDPSRLASLDSLQETVMRELLEILAYSLASVWQEEARQALDEWWINGARYRPKSG
jgi:hypothetical protein